MLHGFPEFWRAWIELMPAFAADYHVVAPDQRGYNRSDKPATVDEYRIQELVADLAGLIDARGDGRATVVAHDWGGAVAWALALRHPCRVARFIALNAPHPLPFARALANDPAQQNASAYMNWLRAPGAEARLAEDEFRRLDRMLRSETATRNWYDESTRRAYHAAWSEPGALKAMLDWYRASPLHPPTPDAPGAGALRLDPVKLHVRVPTRVVWGVEDVAMLPVVLDGLETLGDDLRIARLAGLGHWLIHEAPTRVTAAIQEALVA